MIIRHFSFSLDHKKMIIIYEHMLLTFPCPIIPEFVLSLDCVYAPVFVSVRLCQRVLIAIMELDALTGYGECKCSNTVGGLGCIDF